MEFIWIQNVRDIDLKVISAAENSNKFPKTRFWKEKSVEDVVTLGPTAQATLVKTKKRKHPTKLATEFEFIPKLAPQHLQQEPTSYFLKPLKSLPILAHVPVVKNFSKHGSSILHFTDGRFMAY
jgi:predicted ATP-grasp superfamily ATP-dependent carboligase